MYFASSVITKVAFLVAAHCLITALYCFVVQQSCVLHCTILYRTALLCTESVPRQEEGSTGKYQHEVEGVPEGAARGNPLTECWNFPVLPDSSQGTNIIQFIKVMKL